MMKKTKNKVASLGEGRLLINGPHFNVGEPYVH